MIIKFKLSKEQLYDIMQFDRKNCQYGNQDQ